MLSVIAVGVSYWSYSHRQLQKHIDWLNSALDRRDTVFRIRARLLANRDLEQEETEFFDVSAYQKLLVRLIAPLKSSSIPKDRGSHVCQLEIRPDEEDSNPIILSIIWLGKGKLLIADSHSTCYVRSGKIYPIRKDKYVDEAAALCGLLQGIRYGDMKIRSSCEKSLRGSLRLTDSTDE
jgi:hypothetical protein